MICRVRCARTEEPKQPDDLRACGNTTRREAPGSRVGILVQLVEGGGGVQNDVVSRLAQAGMGRACSTAPWHVM